MNLTIRNVMARLGLLPCLLVIAMLVMTSCETEKLAPASKANTAEASAVSSTIFASGTYSTIYGPTTSCPGRTEAYTFEWRNYNMMIPKGTTLTVSNGYFTSTGSTTMTIGPKVGQTDFQVHWNGAGTLSASSKWSGYGNPTVYTENISGSVSMTCQ